MATSSPRNPAIQPFSGSLGAVRLPQITMPKIASQKNSKDLNLRAKLPISGVKKANISKPMTEPRNEPVVAMPMALPANPCSGQRIAVHSRGGIGRGSGNVQQNGAAAAAIDGADVHAHQNQHGCVGCHFEGQRGHQGHAHGRRQTGQHADNDAQLGGPQNIQNGDRVFNEKSSQRPGKHQKSVNHGTLSTKPGSR